MDSAKIQDAYEVGPEAYVYFYSAVSIDLTRRIGTNIEAGKIPMFGPMNAFSHARTYPTNQAVTRDEVIRPHGMRWSRSRSRPSSVGV